MEIGAAAAGVSAGVQALWGYNRKNYLYDREQRQKNEYQVLAWRKNQAGLWRDDVKDLIGLTEKKMDKYTLVAALQLGMCVALFTEGRLAPGTPPWLLHFYMLTLSAAFLYLLMSVWLAMHASVVAQCCSARLLTQFVRLPVPTWDDLERCRTYAQSYEQVKGKHAIRVPFVSQASGSASSAAEAKQDAGRSPAHPDPWEREQHGDQRNFHELQEVPLCLRRHIKLAERAAEQYKCFDAFARVAMTFGTNQMLQAIAYYSLGYASVQDGAPWAAWCVGIIMSTISLAMIYLDVSLKRNEQLITQVLLLAGPLCVSAATWLWARHGLEDVENTIMTLLPVAYASHALWLLWALQICNVQRLPCGSILPTRFRAVLYLDVFGWMRMSDQEGDQEKPRSQKRGRTWGYQPAPMRQEVEVGCNKLAGGCYEFGGSTPDTVDEPDMGQMQQDVREQIELWQSDRVQCVMDDQEKARVAELARRFHSANTPEASSSCCAAASDCSGISPKTRSPWVKLHGYSDFGVEAPYLYDPETGAVSEIDGERSVPLGQADHRVRTITFAEEDVERYCTHANSAATSAASGGQPQGRHLGRAPRAQREPARGKAPSDGSSLWCLDASLVDHGECRTADLVAIDERDEPEERPEPEIAHAGPSGEFVDIPQHIFHPTSFAPPHEISGTAQELEESEVINERFRMRPGELPWRIFSSATLMLAALWATGLAIPFSPFQDMMTKPIIAEIPRVREVNEGGPAGVEKFAVGTDPSGLPEYIPEPDMDSIPKLPEGELIRATWPSHSGFKPRALSRAPHGKQLVVADDFGVYVGQLFDTPAAAGSEGPAVVHSVHFRKAPPCAALEGHSLKDISVACSEGASPVCRVLVLHTHGRRLVECPLFSPEVAGSLARGDGEFLPPTRPSLMWEISSDWLHSERKNKKESVESVAVNNECLVGAFNPNKVGCVVVGTTSGRIVQMRGHLTNETRLVPERAVQQYSRAVEHGSLHVFPNGFVVALHKRMGTIEAFDTSKGETVGQWRLPQQQDVKWMTVSGGGDNFYVMGQKNNTDFALYRFPVPEELRSGELLNRDY